VQVGPSRKEPPVLVSTTVSCEHAEVLVSRRLDGELDPSDALLLDAHLECCEICRAHLQSWTNQSDTLSQSLNGLWSVPSDALLVAVKFPQPKAARPFWVPLGMMASQFAALIGLALYIMFCATPASAPDNDRVTDRSPRPTAEAKSAIEAAPAAPLPIESVKQVSQISEEIVVTVAVAEKVETPAVINVSHVEAPAPEKPVVKEQALASISVPYMPMLIPNVSADFEIAIPGSSEKDSGRVAILGDFFNGKAVIRLVDSSGAVSEIAQPDLNTLLSEPRRGFVKRFLAECSRPEMRSRFKEILRRQTLDAPHTQK
jgi:anti-sigma factor RsiW